MQPPFSLDSAQFLVSPNGQAALAKTATLSLHPDDTLQTLTQLRHEYTPERAGALLTLARLRQKASAKFLQSDKLFYTPESLEQATAWPIAQHRAAWFDEHASAGPILDLGCGIGGDTLALAQKRPVFAYEQDPIRLCFAQANIDALGLTEQVEFRQADWTADLKVGKLPKASAAFVDPNRRKKGKRVFSLHQMEPPLTQLLALQHVVPALGVKVMPSVKSEELPSGCNVEFISHAGVCKEAILWFDLPAASPSEQATRWASVHTAQGWQNLAATAEQAAIGPIEAGYYLHEPDPAVIRAGAFAPLCQMLDAHLFDPQIAYLVSPTLMQSQWVQTFQIEEVHPFKRKLLNQRLKALGIGQVELKKRGFPVEPETLRPQLKLVAGGRAGVVIFTRRGEQRLMLIGHRV